MSGWERKLASSILRRCHRLDGSLEWVVVRCISKGVFLTERGHGVSVNPRATSNPSLGKELIPYIRIVSFEAVCTAAPLTVYDYTSLTDQPTGIFTCLIFTSLHERAYYKSQVIMLAVVAESSKNEAITVRWLGC